MSALLIQIGDRSWVFHDEFTVGRPGTGVSIEDEYASPHHAGFRPDGAAWTVEGLGSTNGVWLNRQRIYGATPLGKGDQVRIGHTMLIVVPAS
jgi:pSer/pThr/pTyr-binding forkhead associated (FHA) protein